MPARSAAGRDAGRTDHDGVALAGCRRHVPCGKRGRASGRRGGIRASGHRYGQGVQRSLLRHGEGNLRQPDGRRDRTGLGPGPTRPRTRRGRRAGSRRRGSPPAPPVHRHLRQSIPLLGPRRPRPRGRRNVAPPRTDLPEHRIPHLPRHNHVLGVLGGRGVGSKVGTRSLNHPMQGGFDAWFYQGVLGINADPAEPGFHHVILRPQMTRELRWAKGGYEGPYGRIVSDWRTENDDFVWHVVVPRTPRPRFTCRTGPRPGAWGPAAPVTGLPPALTSDLACGCARE